MRLDHLRPGTRFRLGDRTGVLLKVNECRARVRYDGPLKFVKFDSRDKHREFVADTGYAKDIAPSVDVQVIP